MMTQSEWEAICKQYRTDLDEAVRDRTPFPAKPIEIGKILMSDPKFRQIALSIKQGTILILKRLGSFISL